jgi:ribosome biogenesis GTPase A
MQTAELAATVPVAAADTATATAVADEAPVEANTSTRLASPSTATDAEGSAAAPATLLKITGLDKDVPAELRKAGYDPAQLKAKVVLMGNTGVGKSALIAAALGNPDAVEHDNSPTAITRDIERVLLRGLSDGHHAVGDVLVYNIPGLIEAGEANLGRNKKCPPRRR